MARPRKIGLDYFPHDVDLSSDDKIGALEGKFGLLGYAFYLKTLEQIYRQGKPIKYPGVFRPIMSGKLKISEEQLSDMVQFCVDIELLFMDFDGNLMSKGASNRLDFIEETREFDRNRVIQRRTTGQVHKVKETKENIREEEIEIGEREEVELEVSTESVLGRMVGRFSSPMPEAEDFQDQDPPKPKPEPTETKGPKTNLSALKALFETARKKYPGQKVGPEPAWAHFIKKHGKGAARIIPLLLPAIEAEAEHKTKLAALGLFCPQWKSFERWINGSYWTQDLEKIQVVLNSSGKQSTFETPSNLKERV